MITEAEYGYIADFLRERLTGLLTLLHTGEHQTHTVMNHGFLTSVKSLSDNKSFSCWFIVHYETY